MPNIKSAIKRVKQNDKRRALNASQKSALRTSVKAVESAIANKDASTALSALQLAAKKLDKAADKGLIHRNAASRKKSRLTKDVNAISAEG